MAAAAYAALLSVMNTVDQLKKYTGHPIFLDEKQIEYLREKVVFLQGFLERYSQEDREEIRVLDSQIRDAAHEAEDVIESHVVDQLTNGSSAHWKENFPFLRDLEKVIQDMDSIEKIAEVIQDRSRLKGQRLKKYPMPIASPSRAPASGNRVMVGFEDIRKEVMESLTDLYSSQHQRVIPIVGMGGSGKTTLAKDVYDDSFIAQHFDIRIWVTVSQGYTIRDILLQIPVCQEEQESTKDLVTQDKLGEVLYKSLFDRRYLFVLDDVWSLEAWDEVNLFLPVNNGTSRIILTTRLSNVAAHFGSCVVRMRSLNWSESWKMLCKYVFAQETCPQELEIIAKDIVGKCKGLPLSVAVIGGLLSSSPRTEKFWGNIANDINSILNSEDDEHFLKVLSLSYKYLPIHLKPCFLYMGLFAEDYRIPVQCLHNILACEGILKSDDKNQNLEEVAKGCINDLVDRNLVFIVHEGVFEDDEHCFCAIHDVLHDLCQRLAQKEGFYFVLRNFVRPRSIHSERRLAFPGRSDMKKGHSSHVLHAVQTASLARTLISSGGEPPFRCRLLRVLHDVNIDSPEDIFQRVNLRYVAYTCSEFSNFKLPSSISLLWNLQALDGWNHYSRVSAPFEIWEMQQLRHFVFREICLPEPPTQVDGQDVLVLENLRVLEGVANFKCSEEVLKRIPHLESLGILYDDFLEHETSSDYCLLNLCRFRKLEYLRIVFHTGGRRIQLIKKLTFPSCLKTLWLGHCMLFWDDVSTIGMLPHLTNLFLLCTVKGLEWDPIDGQFLSLKVLHVKSCINLMKWNANSSHFPILRHLRLDSVPHLEELPSDIGESTTLKSIGLAYCKATAAISAMQILDEQVSFGNNDLTMQVSLMNMQELELFEATLQSQGKETLSNNFQLLWPKRR